MSRKPDIYVTGGIGAMTAAEPAAPQELGTIAAELQEAGFEDAEEVGRGGFGAVYKCRQPHLERVVAVKVLSSDLSNENRERFLREEHAMGRLSGHPNIVDILQVDITDTGRPFIVMPFHSRGSFDSVLQRRGPLAWDEAVRIGIKLAGAVESAHWVGILHRDIKPGNILLTAYDEPQLTDFGIARVRGSFETSQGLIAGSPAFMAPELLKGEQPTELSDVYGLAATLFSLITGHAAIERRAGEKVVAQFVRMTSQPLTGAGRFDLPADLSAAIEAAMSHEKSERPRSAAEFGVMLQQIGTKHGLPPDKMALPADVDIEQTIPRRDRDSRRLPDRPEPTDAPAHPANRNELVRNRLIVAATSGPESFTVVRAPGGFGKSVLLEQIRDALVDADKTVALVGVERNGETSGDIDAILTDAIAGRLSTLLIDDWDRLGESDARSVVAASESSARIVVAGRTDPTALPQYRFEITTDAMRLDHDEIRELLVDLNGLMLTDAAVDDLRSATNGWVAVLALVALSLRGSPGLSNTAATRMVSDAAIRAAKLLRRMANRPDALVDGLVANALNTLEPRMRSFLLNTAVTDRTSPSIAAALIEQGDARALLIEAAQRGLFLRASAESPGWYTFAPLYADSLRRQLDREHPRRREALLETADQLFAHSKSVERS
jgi:serine/threonine-protein kinase PknK